MYYICVEDNRVVSVLDYRPSVPDSVSVIEISNDDFHALDNQTHFFDVETNQVVAYGSEKLERDQQLEQNREHEKYLRSTDWQVLRHIRQKALGVPTSLSDAEYLDLELERNRRANSIIH